MNSEQKCPQCHQPLAADALAGLCPQCLLGQALAAPPAGTVVRYFGDYELVKEIARGAMGVVYKARQVSLNRLVALKMILAGRLATPELIQRFRIEAEAAAHLDHPHIVPIYEVGEHEGIQYFSMRLLEGGNLAQRLARLPGEDLKTAVGWLIPLVRAVHYAHQRGILHRDLKPANILLDAEGRPQVSDFGLAKLLESSADVTVSGAVMGTPAYMAPEQAAGETRHLTTAVDVYGLGAILYHMLTGHPPFAEDTPLKTMKQVREADPVRPRTLNPKVDRDLETICLKCLEKDPRKRYESAEALARDLERWQAGEPIRARPVGVMERLGKWIRRRKAVSALIVLAILTAAGFAAGLNWHQQRLQREQSHAEELISRKQAEQGIQLLKSGNETGLLYLLQACQTAVRNPSLQNAWASLWAAWHEPYRDRLLHVFGDSEPIRAFALSPDGKLIATATDQRVDYREIDTGQPHGRSLDVRERMKIDEILLRIFPGEDADMKNMRDLTVQFGSGTNPTINKLVWRPDGKVLVGLQGLIWQVWDPDTEQPVGIPFCPGPCDPDGLATIGRSPDGFRLQDSLTGDWLGPPAPDAPVDSSHMALSRGGKWLAIAVQTNAALWELSSGRSIALWLKPNAEVRQFLFSRDSTLLAAKLLGGMVQLWDAATGRPQGAPLPLGINRPPDSKFINTASGLAFSPDGSLLAFNADNGVHLYRTDPLEPIGSPIAGHGDILHDAAFSPDGKLLLTATPNGQLQLWTTQNLQPYGRAFQHSGPILDARFTPDGRRLVTLSKDGTARLWTVDSPQTRPQSGRPASRWRGLAFSAAADTLGIKVPGHMQFHSATALKPLGESVPLHTNEWLLALSPDARLAVTLEDHRIVRIRDRISGQILGQLPEISERVHFAEFSPDGKRLATVHHSGNIRETTTTIQTWNMDDLQPVGHAFQFHLGLGSIRFNSDGRLIMIPSPYGGWVGWDAAAGQMKYGNLEDRSQEQCPALSPSGRFLVTRPSSVSQTLQVVDLETGSRREIPLSVKRDWIPQYTAVADDGKTVAIGFWDDTTQLWDTETGQPLGQPLKAKGSLQFSPDGQFLVVGLRPSTLWQVANQFPVATPFSPDDCVLGFTPDGAWLRVRVNNHEALWPLPRPPADLRDMARQTWRTLGARLDADGILETISGPEWRSLRNQIPENEHAAAPEWIYAPKDMAAEFEPPIFNSPIEYLPYFDPGRINERAPSPAFVRTRIAQLTGCDPDAATLAVIHYHRTDQNYDGWKTWVWPEAPTRAKGRFQSFTGRDHFGPYAVVCFKERLSKVGFLVCKDGWTAKDGPEDRYFNVDTNGLATIWVYSGQTRFNAIPPAPESEGPAR